MQELQLIDNPRMLSYQTTWRDVVGGIFRRRKLMLGTFLVVFAAAVAFALLWPGNYESEAKFLVTHERQDPVISAESKSLIVGKSDVTSEDINSEVELLTSDDLMNKVVKTCELDKLPPSLPRRVINLFSKDTDEQRLARAVNRLESKLTVQPVSDSNIIRVTYDSGDPQIAAKVVRSLSDLYLEKHLAVHRPPGIFQFFDKETQRYKDQLTQAQDQLATFTHEVNSVSALAERDASLQKALEMEAVLRTTRSDIKQTQDRIASLRTQLAQVPGRIITSDRNGDAGLLAQLQGNLVTLELKRTELLRKYQPTYPAVQELEKQIAQTKEAVATDQKTPIREVTTDRNPTAQLLHDDMAKSEAELASLRAKEAATRKIVEVYRDEASRYFDTSIAQQNLQREAKVAEDNYLLYSNKREEARIADALDSRKVVNVSVAEAATLPVFPTLPVPLLIVAGFMLAVVAGLGSGIAVNFIDTSLHSPKEIERYLDVPVLAAIPDGKQ